MSDFLSQVIRETQKRIREEIEATKRLLGEAPGREKVDPRKQMEAYLSLTDADIAELELKYGAERVARYITEMEKRLRRRQRRAVK